MRNKCNLYEIFVLYAFSAYYLLKEFFGRLFLMKSGLEGQVFLRCEGRTALITGGNCGIGFETARKLLSFGMNVIIGSNASPYDCDKCLRELRIAFPKCKVEIWYVDLACMGSVKSFAQKYLLSGLPLHLLINNAGVMFAPKKITGEGLESHMAINYFSHCLLTKLLLPQLQQSASPKFKARIVNVASCLHYLAEIDFQDMNSVQSYCPHHSYTQSKLCQVMFTQSLNQYLKKSGSLVNVNCVHPGVIYSNLYRYVWWAPYLGPFFFKKPDKGAEISVFAALSVKLEVDSGKYIEECRIVKPSNYSRNVQLQNRLWNETWKTLQPWLDEIEEIESDY